MIVFLLASGCSRENRVKFVPGDQKVDVMIDGNLVAVWQHRAELTKPVFHPVYTLNGEVVTRWYPFREVEGERHDHPHHTGLFFTYEGPNDVNFWAARVAPPQIIQKEQKLDETNQSMSTVMEWTDKNDRVLLRENRDMIFIPGDSSYSIDFTIRLTAVDSAAVFEDSKEGMFAIRVASWLKGRGGTGKYMNAEGQETEENVWGRRSKWMQLEGTKDQQSIGIVIFNHPSSLNYPNYWHARDYGLFAANPLGQGVFQKSRNEPNPEPFNLVLQKDQSALFKYRVLIYQGSLSKDEVEQIFVAYASE
jgi:hypothetical protein